MTKFMIYSYTQNSKSAKALAEELGGRRILRQGSTYIPKPSDIIINWGASDCPFPQALNPDTLGVTNKNKFFKRLDGTGLTPPSCITKAAAALMNFPVFCRTKVEGHDGSGIVIANSPDELVHCNLYVEGVNKTAEYRIHIGRLPSGAVTIIGAQKKYIPDYSALPNDQVWTGDGTKLIWNVNGSPVFLPPAVLTCVKAAFEKFPELTFGAFDAVYCSDEQRAYVLEINSAPMMTPETAKRYGQFFRAVAGSNTPAVATASEAPQTLQSATATLPEPVQLTIKVPQSSVTMVQNLLAAVGVHFQ